MKDKIIPIVAVLALLLAGWAVFVPKQDGKSLFGAAGGLLAENYIPYVLYNGGYNTAKSIATTGDFKLGSSGTSQANQISTTCSTIADSSLVATTTGYAYCTGVTGVTSSDNIVAQFATSTLGHIIASDSFWIVSAKASSTAGAIDFLVYNGAGRTVVPSVAGRAASTTSLWVSH